MRFYPDITLTRLFMVMKTLVNFKAHNLKVVGSNPTPATNKYVVIQRLNNALSFSAGGFFCVFWPIYPDIYIDIYPDIYSYDCQIMLEKNNK